MSASPDHPTGLPEPIDPDHPTGLPEPIDPDHPTGHPRPTAHNHASAHDGHSHGVSADADRGKLTIALALILGFMAVEVAVGFLSGSLALISDAAHMLTDAAALGVSLWAVHLAARPAVGRMTFGFKRAEILSAQFNGATLLVLGLLIVYEAIRRLVRPPAVAGTAVLAVALAGIVVNLLASYTLASANRESMNVEGSFQHILTDLAAFVFTAAAGAVILATGFRRADGIASLFVATIMLRAAYGLLKASGRVFLEAAPEGVDPDRIGHAMAASPGVVEIHDLHVWEVTSGFPAMSAHVVVVAECDCHEIARGLKQLLHDEFAIDHTTLQVDHQPTELLSIELPEQRERRVT
jgi:cobalt-zinc-cadmium efflux system protein